MTSDAHRLGLAHVTEPQPTHPHSTHAPQGTLVGWGPYNPDSMFRVRLLWHVSEAPLAAAPLRHRLAGGLRDAQLPVLLHERVGLAEDGGE